MSKRNHQNNDVQRVVDSFNHGILDIVSIWLLFCGIVLFLGVEFGGTFVVIGWVICSIVALIWLVGRTATKQDDDQQDDNHQDVAIDPQRLDGAQRLLNACDQCGGNNPHINHLCTKVRDTINWIRAHNTQQYSNQIDIKLRNLELDAAELSIFLQFT